MTTPNHKMCLDCIYSDLSRLERISFRLTGEEFEFECLHRRAYIKRNIPGDFKCNSNISQYKHSCIDYILCK